MYSFPGQSPAPTSAPDMHSSDASYGTPFTDDLAPDRSHQHGSTVQDPYLPSILGMKWTTNLKSVGISKIAEFDIATTESASDSFADITRHVRRLGLLPVCQHGVVRGVDCCSSSASLAAADILLDACPAHVRRDLRRIHPESNDARVIYSFMNDCYVAQSGGVMHYTAEAQLKKITWETLVSPSETDAKIRTTVLDFFALTLKLAPSRRGDVEYWARDITYNLPAQLKTFAPELRSFAEKHGSALQPIKFANEIVKKVHEFRLSSPRGAASFADLETAPLLTATTFKKQIGAAPTCPDCSYRDCPRAKDTAGACDVHSPLDPARLIALLVDKKNYAEMILRRRANIEKEKSRNTANTAAMSNDTTERDAQLAAQMDALAALAGMRNLPAY